ncbi:hypothetical protein KIKIMORA_02500 [Brevundimonas phage vB_BpoS-Kikimora]|uniref:Uncharacterized protein n=1 Tax=Brevundimonas phage vB_BpoS-Kikimora TaxID=2948601 RepID=A0A9E7MTJ9_9CAUD|nr:hypothetical protein KIKIMORA_02500 [Brevundimonas phage vB_BpoS-Kikimora]
MYCILISTARRIGKKPGLRLGWVTKVNPDGTVRALSAPITFARDMPKWTKTPRTYRPQDIAQLFGKNVRPNKTEVEAIRRRQRPYNPQAGQFDQMGFSHAD